MATGGVGESGDHKLSNLECSICMEKYESARGSHKIPKVINCGHTYCDECVKSMIKNNRLDCPTCHKVSNVSQDGFSTNYDLLSLVDAEETRAKSFKYNCSDCSIGLALDTAFKCKGNHEGVICLKCYSTKHGAHGGIEQLKVLLIENRLKIGDALVRLEDEREKYKRLEVAMSTQRTMLDEWVKSVVTTNESINKIFDEFRSEMDEIDVIKRLFYEDGSRSIETLTISGRFESFIGDCNFGNAARVQLDSAMVRCKFNVLETTLWALRDQWLEMKHAARDDYFSTRKAHRLGPYLELLKSKADGDGSGDLTQGTEIAGSSSSNTVAPSDRPIQVQTPFTYSPQDFRSAQVGGERTMLDGGQGVVRQAIRGGRGRGYTAGNRGCSSAD